MRWMFQFLNLPVAILFSAGIVHPQLPVATPEAASNSPNGAQLNTQKALPVKVPRFDQSPTIDGKLDDEVWQHAAKLADFYQTSPGDNIAASKPTEVLLGFDTRCLYVAFHAYDDPSKVRASLAKRDDILNDDYVGMLLDTFDSHRKAYELDFNPLGIQQDGLWQDPIFNEDFNPDFVMESKGSIVSDGYVVEVAIPFKSLSYQNGKNKLWGVHFYRRIKRINNELDSWMPIDRSFSGWMMQEGHISGLEGISNERTLEFTPSLTVSETGNRRATLNPTQVNAGLMDRGKFVNDPVKLDLGLTGKFSIASNLKLDFAINPDFAQVEADQLVVTANQRFPIFFPEKRPFFLEGTDIFSTLINAVSTRSIIDPDVAMKLSGKMGTNSFSTLVASDNGPGNLSSEDRDFLNESPEFIAGTDHPTANQVASVLARQARLRHLVNKNAIDGIFRFKRDIATGQSYIGFLATTYDFAGISNRLASMDGLYSLDRQTTFSWQVLGSTSKDDFFFPKTGITVHKRENGFGYAYDLTRNGRQLLVEASGNGETQFFRTLIGFQTRVNFNRDGVFIQYTSEPKPKAKIVSWRIYANPSILFDWQGREHLANDEIEFQLNFRRQGTVGVGLDTGYERLFEEEFGTSRQAGPVCVILNTCTFSGHSDERSTPNYKIYVFGGAALTRKITFFTIARFSGGNFDLDFGAGPRFPRVSPVAVAAREATAQGLCAVSPLPAICNSPLDPGPGTMFSMDASGSYQITRPLSFSFSLTTQRLKRYDTGLVAFSENLATFKTTYQFTRFVFVRGRIDFDSLASNVKGQFLFGWTPNPGTAIYVGYNDDLNTNGFNPFTGQFDSGVVRNARTFFIKMSYLFRRDFGN